MYEWNLIQSKNLQESDMMYKGKINTEGGQKYSSLVFFCYIFHIKPQFFKKLYLCRFSSDLSENFTVKQRIVSSVIVYLDIIFGLVVLKKKWVEQKCKIDVTILLEYIGKSDVMNSALSLLCWSSKIIHQKIMSK